jgi:hypothetical protein
MYHNYLIVFLPFALKAASNYMLALEENCRSATVVPQKSSVSMLLFVFQEGQQHAVMLYTWRCCSRAIPQPKVHYPSTSVADPGSGAFLTPGSGMGKIQDPDPG